MDKKITYVVIKIGGIYTPVKQEVFVELKEKSK